MGDYPDLQEQVTNVVGSKKPTWMPFLKNILVGLGLVFLAVTAITIYLWISTSNFFNENRDFVRRFSFDFSREWRISDVHGRLTNQLIELLDTPTGNFAYNQLKALGPLNEIADLELRNFHVGTDGKSAVITYKGSFRNAKGLVTVTIVEKNGKVLVDGFYVSALDGMETSETKYET